MGPRARIVSSITTDLAHIVSSRGATTDDLDARRFFRGSVWLVVSVVVGALTSALFWLVAANVHTSGDVGRASGLFTSVLFVCFASGLGLPVAMSHFLARARGADSLFSWGLALSVPTSGVAAVLYLTLVDSPSTAVLQRQGWTGPLLFVAVSVGGALTLLVDVRLLAARRWGCMLARVTAVGVLQIVLVGAGTPIAEADLWLFVAAAGPTSLSGILGVALLPMLVGQGYRLRPRPMGARVVLRYASVNYLASLGLEAPRFVLPVIVLVNVPAAENANFYVAWAVVAVVLLVPTTLAQLLLVEGSRGNVAPPATVFKVVGATVGIMAAAWIAALFLQGAIPAWYGADYRSAGRLLPLLMAAGMPWALASVALADARSRRDHRATLLITITFSSTVVLPALLLVPSHGVAGVSVPWLGGNLAAALIGLLVLPRRRSGGPPSETVA